MADNIPNPFQFEPRYNVEELRRRREQAEAAGARNVEVEIEPVRDHDRILQDRLEGKAF